MRECTGALPRSSLSDRSHRPPADSGATSVGGLPLRTHPSGGPPSRLLAICLTVASGFWGLARLRPGSALCAAADPAVAAGPPGLQPGLHRRAALDPGPGCRPGAGRPLDGLSVVVVAAGGHHHQPLRLPPGGAGHAATSDLGDRRSPPADLDVGTADPADPRLARWSGPDDRGLGPPAAAPPPLVAGRSGPRALPRLARPAERLA